jgi:hypothetical protein
MTCRACRHKDRPAIERMILDRVEFRTIARHFGIATTIVWRHRHHHMKDAFRRLAQRLEGADAYNAQSVSERLMTLNLLNMSLLSKAVAKNNIAAAVGASRQLRENLQFEQELLSEGALSRDVRIEVVYGDKYGPTLNDGKPCPTCKRVYNMQEVEQQYTMAIERTLGLAPLDGEAELHAVEQCETDVHASLEERIGAYRIERQPSQPEPQVIEAHIVPQPPPRPQRQPARLARQPRALLSVGAEQPFVINKDTRL